MIVPLGALVNAAAILVGGVVGLLLKGRISKNAMANVMKAIGLCVAIIGISGALNGDIMLLVSSLALGTFAGELINLHNLLERLGENLKNKFAKQNNPNTPNTFAEGFVVATLLFCVGAMAIVGSLEAGINNDYNIIFTKSIIDGASAMIFASLFGYGVLFSAVAVLLYQGFLEFFASHMQHIMTDSLITQISAVGGIMILAIGVNMVMDTKIRVANFLPSVIVAIGYYLLFVS